MGINKKLFQSTIPLLILLFFCYPYKFVSLSSHEAFDDQPAPRRTPENIRHYCDSLRRYNDSLNVIFQKESFHQKRSLPYLWPILDTLSIRIAEAINKPAISQNVKTQSAYFNILPSGRFKFSHFSVFPKSDTSSDADLTIHKNYSTRDSVLKVVLDSIAMKYSVDTIPGYQAFLVVKGVFSGTTAPIKFSFMDTSYYVSPITVGRSKASIMRVVMQNLSELREAYNLELRNHFGLKGKITLKFAIDENGYVIFSKVVPSETTINHKVLEHEFADIVFQWKFEKIDKRGDVTEVVYPFVLSQ